MITLEPDATVFPWNFVVAAQEALQKIDPYVDENNEGLRIYRRRLHETDATESIGIYPTVWEQDPDSIEFSGRNVVRATITRYPIEIVAFIHDMDEIEGARLHYHLAALIRDRLLSDEDLEAELGALRVSNRPGHTESVARYGILSQSFINVWRESAFEFMSTTEFYVDTQTN